MVLAGVKAVTIHDTKSVELADLGAQFFLSEASIGKNKADACRAQLQELNTAVEVSASSAALTEEFLGKFQVRAVFNRHYWHLVWCWTEHALPWRLSS